MGQETLREKTAKGLFWGALNNGTMQLLNIVIGIFLARLLSPSDYGLVGMLAVFTAIAKRADSPRLLPTWSILRTMTIMLSFGSVPLLDGSLTLSYSFQHL